MSFAFLSRSAVNLDAKEGKEWKEDKEWKEVNKEGKEVERCRPMSVASSLSYRKQSNLDFTGGKGDAVFSALKENAESEDTLCFHKAKHKTLDIQEDTYSASSRGKFQAGESMNGRESVYLAYSEVNSQAKKGVDTPLIVFDKESAISFTAPSRASARHGVSPTDDAKSTISIGLSSPLGYRQSNSRSTHETGSSQSLYGSSPSSPCSSRPYGGCSPGSISHMSLARSSRLSKFDIDADDSLTVAFSEMSGYSLQSSTGRGISMPPPQARSSTTDNDPVDNLEIKTVSHRNYLDPDLEKAINAVLSFKPIKFRRSNLEDTEDEVEKSKNDGDGDDNRSIQNRYRICPASSLRRSASAVDCSSRHCSKSKGKSKKKKRSHSSESNTSGEDHCHRSSSKRRFKKSKKMSEKRDQSTSSSSSCISSNSDSDSGSKSNSGASTISYQSSSSVKWAPALIVSSPEIESKAGAQRQPLDKKDDMKRKKKVDSLMMKYLYRPDSD